MTLNEVFLCVVTHLVQSSSEHACLWQCARTCVFRYFPGCAPSVSAAVSVRLPADTSTEERRSDSAVSSVTEAANHHLHPHHGGPRRIHDPGPPAAAIRDNQLANYQGVVRAAGSHRLVPGEMWRALLIFVESREPTAALSVVKWRRGPTGFFMCGSFSRGLRDADVNRHRCVHARRNQLCCNGNLNVTLSCLFLPARLMPQPL